MSPEKVTLSNKLKETGHVEEHGGWNSRCKGPESESRPSVMKGSKCGWSRMREGVSRSERKGAGGWVGRVLQIM